MSATRMTLEAFESQVLDAKQTTLVDFSAEWCGPCRIMGPVIDELAVELEGQAKVLKVDIDESPEVASQYGIQAVPTFLVVRDGTVTNRLVGVQSKAALALAVAG